MYAGLKTGVSVSAAILAPIMGFGIIQTLTKIVPNVNWLGGPFGARETAVIQATARAAAGTSVIFTGLIPTMFKLGFYTSVSSAVPPLLLLSLTCTVGGLFAAAPLRSFFITRSARELKIRFPACEFLANPRKESQSS
jgi:uncharacterized oligopeptide transporter (OPT) family protein